MRKWVDNIKTDLEMGLGGGYPCWIPQDTDQWLAVVITALNLLDLSKMRGMSWLAKKQLVSQERLCSIELFWWQFALWDSAFKFCLSSVARQGAAFWTTSVSTLSFYVSPHYVHRECLAPYCTSSTERCVGSELTHSSWYFMSLARARCMLSTVPQ